MFAVSISLGSTSAYVSVAPVAQQPGSGAAPQSASIKIVANSAGHRNTPVAASLTEQEVLFGENAIHTYVRQPQQVVPYLFSYSAAAAAVADAAQSKSTASAELASHFLSIVERGARVKYRGHCPLEEREVGDGIHRHGFAYETSGPNGDAVEQFASAEDLFVQFLNYLKEHSIDGACGLSGRESGGEGAKVTKGDKAKPILLTIVVPRSAFPTLTTAKGSVTGVQRGDAVEWLADAVRASQLNEVSLQTTILFSDEAALMAFDSVPRAPEQPRPYFLLPPTTAAPGSPALGGGNAAAPPANRTANVLVVDWGARALCFSLLPTSGGLLRQPKGGIPFLCCTAGGGRASNTASTADFVSSLSAAGSGGDALDVSLADKMAANYMVVNRRTFQSLVPNMRPLQDLISTASVANEAAAAEAHRIVSETIPSRAMRRLKLLMGEKKVALNTNPQASSVSVEMEAFFEGMDLVDNQTLSRNRFETAIVNEWQCIEHFEQSLGEFVQRHRRAMEAHGVNHVLLTGGMLQVPSVVQGVRRALLAPRNPEVRSVLVPAGVPATVLDASAIGNGVAADELFCVGGCLHSHHLASLAAARKSLAARVTEMQRKKKRTVAAKIAAESLREQQSALAVAWAAMTEFGAEDEEDDDGDDDSGSGKANGDTAAGGMEAETTHHAFLLKRSVYLYTANEGTMPADVAADGAVTVPRSSLTTLFAAGSALPARRACPLPASSVSGDDEVLLHLLVDHTAASVGADSDSVTVHAVTGEGIRVPLASPSTSPKESDRYVVFTVRTDVEEEGLRTVVISVQAVTASGALPQMLHPGNTADLAEARLC